MPELWKSIAKLSDKDRLLRDLLNHQRQDKKTSDKAWHCPRCKKTGFRIRASGLPFCPRAYYFLHTFKYGKMPGSAGLVLQATADEGTAVHALYQQWFGDLGLLWGNWKCGTCGRLVRNKLGTQTCKHCDKEMTYEEYTLTHPDRPEIESAHADGILILKDGRILLLEIKTRGINRLRYLKVPDTGHVYQSTYYTSIIKRNPELTGGKVPTHILLWYTSRDYHHIPVRFLLEPSDDLYDDVVSQVEIGRRALQRRKLPKGPCTSPDDEQATYCPWRSICFLKSVEKQLNPKLLDKLDG